MIFFNSNSFAADDSCTKLISDFSSSSKVADGATKDKLIRCKAFCDKTPNYNDSKNYCGIDECKLQYASTGKPSTWCCHLAKNWGLKQGATTNPLEPLKEACTYIPQDDFMQCVETYNGSGIVSDQCCTHLQDIARFDSSKLSGMYQYCTQRRSAQVCKAQITKGIYSNACCSYAAANDNKILGTEFFKGDSNLARYIEGGLGTCKGRKDNHDYIEQHPESLAQSEDDANSRPTLRYDAQYEKDLRPLNACTTNYNNNKRITPSCCIAFYNGVLIPGKGNNINFIDLDKYCYPEHYE